MQPETLKNRLSTIQVLVSDETAAALTRYHALLMDWNTRMDLTAVLDEDEMLDRHYVDSLSALAIPGMIPQNARLIDVGTGAGFPGMPLAIARPDVQVTLLDSLQKRLTFLQAVIDELGLKNVTLVHARAEDGARMPQHRGAYDVAVARAVASLPLLCEYLLPYVKTGGKAVCWKGPAVENELTQGKRAAFLLGAKLGESIPVTIPGRDWEHRLLVIDKTAPTPKTYPRKAGIPAKKPLGAGE